MIFEDVEADRAVRINVRMVYFRLEGHLGRLEGVIVREMDAEKEDSALIRRVFWAHDGGLPAKLLFFIGWACRTVRGRVTSEVDQFFLNPFE